MSSKNKGIDLQKKENRDLWPRKGKEKGPPQFKGEKRPRRGGDMSHSLPQNRELGEKDSR